LIAGQVGRGGNALAEATLHDETRWESIGMWKVRWRAHESPNLRIGAGDARTPNAPLPATTLETISFAGSTPSGTNVRQCEEGNLGNPRSRRVVSFP